MFMLRPFAWLFAALLVVVAAASIFILTFDANRYKPDLVALVKQQTGRDLAIGGEIGLSVYPDIALKLEQVKLGNAAGFSGETFASADHARVSVQLMPLLQQQLRVNDVTLQGMSLNLQRNKSGVTNWADLLPANSSQKDDQVGQVIARLLGNFMVAGISVQDSQIHWQDAQSGQNLNISPLNLKTGVLRPGKPVDINLATHLQQNSPALDVTLDGSATARLAENQQDFKLSDLKLKVQMPNKPSAGDSLNANLSAGVDGNLQTKVLAFSGLVAAIDIASKAQGNIHADVKGTLRGETDAQQYFMPDLQAQVQLPQVGNAQLSGRMQANLAREEVSIGGLRVQAQLNNPKAGKVDANLSGNMHLGMAEQLLKIDGMQLQAKTQGGNLPMQTADVQASGSTRVQLAQQQLTIGGLQLTTNLQGDKLPGGSLQQQGKGELDLNWGSGKGVIDLFQTSLKLMGQQLNGKLQIRDPIAALSMSGEFKADALNYPPFQLQKATLGVQMADGILTLAPQGTLFKGGYQGNIQINTKQSPPTLQMTHKTSALRTEDLFFALTQDKTITGALNLTANLTSVAGDAAAFKQHLNGTVDVALKDGTIRDSSFAQKTKQVVKLFEKESTNAMGEKEVAFTSLGGQWQVHQGTFHTDENVLLAPYFQVKGSGDVNTVNESLDFKLRIGEKPKPDKPEGLFAPLHIQGPWKNLSYELELDVLLKELAKQEIDKQKADLKEKLDAEKQKQLDALKQKADEEKARLQQQLQTEKDKLQQRLQDQVQKQLGGSGNPADGSVQDQLKKKLEDDLKGKLKGLF
ncbi:MAG: AsmA family protein [Thiothrix sp.]|uniref:AsmA family protein n=1 Tax=Thiothrix sp. TaxID=1032 RepID=UPI0026390981|nr:AsmA family protein [Thiothrix sp.]MDD5391539.1 AsmA family protein [Thiothrix sp.]